MSQVPAAVLATRVGLRSALTVARSSSAGPRALPLASISLGDLGARAPRHPCGGEIPSRCTAELEVCPSVFPQKDTGRPLACVSLCSPQAGHGESGWSLACCARCVVCAGDEWSTAE